MFSKKHYEVIAKVIQELPANGRLNSQSLVAESFADVFESDNPRFDRERFIWVCLAAPTREDLPLRDIYPSNHICGSDQVRKCCLKDTFDEIANDQFLGSIS